MIFSGLCEVAGHREEKTLSIRERDGEAENSSGVETILRAVSQYSDRFRNPYRPSSPGALFSFPPLMAALLFPEIFKAREYLGEGPFILPSDYGNGLLLGGKGGSPSLSVRWLFVALLERATSRDCSRLEETDPFVFL